MNDMEAIQQFGLPADKGRRDEIIALFEAELRKEENEEGDQGLIKCLSAQLFPVGNVEDSLLIWRAKSQNFDLMCGLDVQFLCGAGLEQRRGFLSGNDSPDAREALKYLQRCIGAGDFDGWSVANWIAYYRFYFHLDREPPPDL